MMVMYERCSQKVLTIPLSWAMWRNCPHDFPPALPVLRTDPPASLCGSEVTVQQGSALSYIGCGKVWKRWSLSEMWKRNHQFLMTVRGMGLFELQDLHNWKPQLICGFQLRRSCPGKSNCSLQVILSISRSFSRPRVCKIKPSVLTGTLICGAITLQISGSF